MTPFKKIISLSACLFLITSFFVSCATEKQKTGDDSGLSEEEINSRYEEIIKNEAEGKVPEGYNPITDSFTTVDFQLTKTDDTVAFNLPENSFAKVTQSSTSFSFLDTSLPKDSFEGSFKTAKGMSLENTISEFLASYKLDSKDILAKMSDELYIPYSDVSENIPVSISFGFSSIDGLAFSTLSSNDLLKALLARGDSQSATDAVIKEIVGDNQTVAIIDVFPTKNDEIISTFTITRFDRKSE